MASRRTRLYNAVADQEGQDKQLPSYERIKDLVIPGSWYTILGETEWVIDRRRSQCSLIEMAVWYFPWHIDLKYFVSRYLMYEMKRVSKRSTIEGERRTCSSEKKEHSNGYHQAREKILDDILGSRQPLSLVQKVPRDTPHNKSKPRIE